MNNKLPKVVIFNAPPSSGKDTAANYCCPFLPSVHSRFKKPLLEMCARILGIEFNDFMKLYEKSKNEKGVFISYNDPDNRIQYFQTMDMREFMIHISENVMKPVFGDMFFGLYAGQNLNTEKWNIFSDGGFTEEIKGLLEYTCKENIIVVKIQRDGCSFANDSRGWIDETLVGETIVIPNNDSIEEFYLRLDYLIENVFVGKE